MRYIVDIDGRRVEVGLNSDLASVDGGLPRKVGLADVAGTPVRLVMIGDEAREVHRVIAHRDGARGRYVLRIDGHRYGIEALDERTRAIRDVSRAARSAQGTRPLTAPMPGLVVRVHVAPGDLVTAGQSIVVMEAMKMENELRAPAAGKVKAVRATIGAAVEKGVVLVEFD
ncbi:MAG TPA: biotin/lipoyl-containing protein [Gemmatimonadaceae bacterium]|nr:biotin/lipoyl-containing protein [Gemmatimonadaceae bacterium]